MKGQHAGTDRSRRFTTAGLIALSVGSLLMMAWVVFAPAAVATHVTPVEVNGNPTCQGVKFDPPNNGTVNVPGFGSITVSGANGTTFDWSSTFGIDSVIVKGGPNANVYTYDPPSEAFGDTGLKAPINPKTNEPYGLSHIEFCFDEDQLGRIEVEKQTDPNGDPTAFAFTGNITANLSDGQWAGNDVNPGTYTVSETVPDGWNLTDITCNENKDKNSTDAGNTATFQVEAGETVRCVFTNTKTSGGGGGGGGGGGATTTTVPPAPTTTTTTSPTVAPTTVHRSETTTTSEEVLPTTVRPGRLAFTGIEDVVPLGTLALILMTGGSGMLWAGARRGRRRDEDED